MSLPHTTGGGPCIAGGKRSRPDLFAGSRRLVGLTPTIFFFAARAAALKIGVQKRNDVAALIADELAGLMQHRTEGLLTDAIRAAGFRGHEWWFDDI